MTQVIIIQGGSLEQFYEQTLAYLTAKYHSYNYNPMSVDPDVESEMRYYEQMAHNIAKDAYESGGGWQAVADALGVPLGKLVI